MTANCKALAFLLLITSVCEDGQDVDGDEAPKSEPHLTYTNGRLNQTNPLMIYVSPSGSDENDGLSLAKAKKTLAGAHKAVVALDPATRDVFVEVQPGDYVAQKRTTWTYTMPKNTIRIGPPLGSSTRPYFTPCPSRSSSGTDCEDCYFFVLDKPGGVATNVHIENLELHRWLSGIALWGASKYSVTGYQRRNRISGCFFHYIGDAHNPDFYRGEACISLRQSSDNIIENNRFQNIKNAASSDYRFLHAVYIKNWSKRNVIRYNVFINVSGDVIRNRNGANYTQVVSNTFIRAGEGALVQDYFDRAQDECPSWGVMVTDNSYDTNFTCGVVDVCEVEDSDVPSGCKSKTIPRISCSRNTPRTGACP